MSNHSPSQKLVSSSPFKVNMKIKMPSLPILIGGPNVDEQFHNFYSAESLDQRAQALNLEAVDGQPDRLVLFFLTI